MKRYLLKEDTNLQKFDIGYGEKFSVKEYFTYISRCKEIKFQKLGDRYLKIVKTKSHTKEKEIDKKIFLKNLNKSVSEVVYKDLYLYDDLKIFVYKKKHKGIVILESLTDEMDKTFLSEVVEDISDKRGFEDSFLALYGNPLKDDKNIYQIMKKLKNMEIVDMKTIIKKDMSVENAVRVKLYELYLKLVQDRFELLKDSDNKANILSVYRKRLRSIITLIKEYKSYFDEELVLKVEENLKYILNKTSIDEELMSLKKKLKRYKNCLNDEDFIEFIQKKDQKITKDVEKFINFIQTREYSIILKQLELLIRESSVEFDEKDEDMNIKTAYKKSLKKRYKHLKKSIKKYIDCEDLDSYEKILNKLYNLESINKEFGFLSKNKKFYKRKGVLSQLIESFEELISILKNMEISKESIKDKEAFECLLERFEKDKKEALKKALKNIKYFKKSKKLFVS